jgi:hypothetical protein
MASALARSRNRSVVAGLQHVAPAMGSVPGLSLLFEAPCFAHKRSSKVTLCIGRSAAHWRC